MALTDESNGTGINAVLPVQPMNNGYNAPYAVPMYYGNGGNNDMFGGDASWLILFLILAMGGWGNGFGGGFGGGFGMNYDFPWLMTGQQNINANTNNGFRDAMLNDNITSVRDGINNLSTELCECCGDMQMAVANGFSQAEISANNRQMANMQQEFNSQTAITGAITNLASQQAENGYENRLATANLGAQIAREACADRETVNLGVRDLLANNTANTQSVLNTLNDGIRSIYDKLCSQELEAERRENANLRSELMFARGQASQDVQTSAIQAGQRALANEVEQYVAPRPIPAYTVQNPNCCYNTCGCVCNM